MLIHSKELLMTGKKYYTLTVVTNPASATCTLTYDGQSYSSKTATVKEGTVVGYSIYHSTYGTQTGSITIDSDKTLICNGTYSTSKADILWNQPTLTADGTLGGDNFAVYCPSLRFNYEKAFQAFDGDNNTRWMPYFGNNYLIMYNPIPLKLATFYINWTRAVNSYTNCTMYGSTDNSNWITLKSFGTLYNGANTLSIDATEYYSYFKWAFSCSSSYSPSIYENINLTAYYLGDSYTYYWDVTES